MKQQIPQQWRQLISRHWSGELNAEEAAGYEKLLAENQQFAEEAAAWRQMRQALSAQRVPQTGLADLRQRVTEALTEQAQSEQRIRAALKARTAPAPSPGFAEGLVRNARREAGLRRAVRRNNLRWGAVAAGVTLAVMLIFTVRGQLTETAETVRGPVDSARQDPEELLLIAGGIGRVQTLHLRVDSQVAMENIRIHLYLPENIEVDGYPSESQLAFDSDLHPGANHITVPVIAFSDGTVQQATVVAEIVTGEGVFNYPHKVKVVPENQAERGKDDLAG